MAFSMIWTTAGLNAISNAQETGFAPLIIARLGISPVAVAGSTATIKALTALPGQTKVLASIGGQLAHAALVHVTLTDHSADAYDVRAIGVYSDTDVLLGVYTQPTPIVSKGAAVQLMFAFDLPLVEPVNLESIIIEGVGFSVPPATRVLQGVAELATPDEVLAGTDDARIVTPLGLRLALRRAAWRNLHIKFGA